MLGVVILGIVTLCVTMVNVIMLSAVILIVVAPHWISTFRGFSLKLGQNLFKMIKIETGEMEFIID